MDNKFTFTNIIQIAVVGAATVAVAGQQLQQGTARGKFQVDNARRLAFAAIAYGQDFDGAIVPNCDGDFNALANTHDKSVRTDSWVLLLTPYVSSRQTFVDPVRGDVHGIFSGPPLTPEDEGFNSLANTYRNQNRFPMYALNYNFLSPLYTDLDTFEVLAETHYFAEATDPAATIFFAESKRWADTTRGFFNVSAPGLWETLSAGTSVYIAWWDGNPCSGDWCGANPDTNYRTHTFYDAPAPKSGSIKKSKGGSVSFLDGHSRYMTASQITAGTSYASAVPAGLENGGSTIQLTNKSKYLWNLSEFYYGIDSNGP